LNKTAVLFSGQGSQYVGMIKDIAEKYPEAAEKIKMADNIMGQPLSSICFDGPAELLKETRNTQPALFLHSAIAYDLVKEKINASAAAGHSVGEYAALYSAGAISFQESFKLVALRGKLMFEAGLSMPGTMFAVIGMEDEKVREICADLSDNKDGNVVVGANYNSPGQVVVSGSAEFLRQNAGEFKKGGARMVKELVVSGAFHSPLMRPAKEKLAEAIDKASFSDSGIPVYTNAHAAPASRAADLKEALIMQLTAPVLWTQTMVAMQSDGFGGFVELGPGKVLQGLVKRSLKGVDFSGVDKAEDIDEILKD